MSRATPLATDRDPSARSVAKLCLLSGSHAFADDLSSRCGTSYTLRLLTTDEVLRGAPGVLEAAIGSSSAVLVDWSADTATAVPVARRIAGPYRVPIFAVCGVPSDHVAALIVGADGTLERPFRPALLEARLLAYRRLVGDQFETANGHGPAAGFGVPVSGPEAPARCRVGALTLDSTARCIVARGEELRLTPRQYQLLAYLMAHAGRCRTRDEILDGAWGIGFDPETNLVDVHVFELRRKLEPLGLRAMVETVRGIGFRLVPIE